MTIIVSGEERKILQHATKSGACFYGFVPQVACDLDEKGLITIRGAGDSQDTLYLVTLTAKGREAKVALEEEEAFPPYDAPVKPFYIDEDGDICDANGWLIAVMPYGIWPDMELHAGTVLDALSDYWPFMTPDEARDKRRADIQRVMRLKERIKATREGQ